MNREIPYLLAQQQETAARNPQGYRPQDGIRQRMKGKYAKLTRQQLMDAVRGVQVGGGGYVMPEKSMLPVRARRKGGNDLFEGIAKYQQGGLRTLPQYDDDG
jgi:hypothetical protein